MVVGVALPHPLDKQYFGLSGVQITEIALGLWKQKLLYIYTCKFECRIVGVGMSVCVFADVYVVRS